MKMLTILAMVAIVAAVGMAGTVTAMSLAQLANAAAGGNPNPNSLKYCPPFSQPGQTHNQPNKCG